MREANNLPKTDKQIFGRERTQNSKAWPVETRGDCRDDVQGKEKTTAQWPGVPVLGRGLHLLVNQVVPVDPCEPGMLQDRQPPMCPKPLPTSADGDVWGA
jgi:hypothetical protein